MHFKHLKQHVQLNLHDVNMLSSNDFQKSCFSDYSLLLPPEAEVAKSYYSKVTGLKTHSQV